MAIGLLEDAVKLSKTNLQAMPGPLNNRELRKLLLSYPAKAIKLLCDQYYNSLLGIAFGLTHDEDAAKDIVQDTFLYLWQNARRVGSYHERSIQHYLVKIVRNKAITHHKKTVHQSTRKMPFTDTSLLEEPVDSRIIQIEATQEIMDAIARFPKRERECLTMKIQKALSNDEIAARLEVGIKAVERSLTSARKRLRKQLKTGLKKK